MLGDFRLLREVGRGGMGAVYLAEQVSLGRQVALKVLHCASISDPTAVERFQRETETSARSSSLRNALTSSSEAFWTPRTRAIACAWCTAKPGQY